MAAVNEKEFTYKGHQAKEKRFYVLQFDYKNVRMKTEMDPKLGVAAKTMTEDGFLLFYDYWHDVMSKVIMPFRQRLAMKILYKGFQLDLDGALLFMGRRRGFVTCLNADFDVANSVKQSALPSKANKDKNFFNSAKQSVRPAERNFTTADLDEVIQHLEEIQIHCSDRIKLLLDKKKQFKSYK
jgi:hypothetical protein